MTQPYIFRRPFRVWSENSPLKQLHHFLGPRLATRANCFIFITALQTLTIIFLFISLPPRNATLADFQSHGDEDPTLFSRPPPDYNRDPTHTSSHPYTFPADNQYTSSPRLARLLRPFTSCTPPPCTIDHWTYLGGKCFYRPVISKDHSAHNASIWSLVQNSWFYSLENDFACPVAICRSQWSAELNLTRHLVSRALHHRFANETPWDTSRLYASNIHLRLNPFWGLEYKLQGSIAVTPSAHVYSGITPKARNQSVTITIRRGFTNKFCDISVDDDVLPEEQPVYIIVPYTGRLKHLRLFYQNIKSLLDAGVNVRLVLATHGGSRQQMAAVDLLRQMQLGLTEGPLSDGHHVHVVVAQGDVHHGNFSRSRALLTGMQHVPQEALLFLCDVDMEIDKEFFENCRFNARRGYQAYFPIVYSLYPYGRRVSREHGYWRRGAYGMVCLYKSDLATTWAWATNRNQQRLLGWGMEDVLLHQEISNHWRMTTFEAVEPNLRHRWHAKHCQFNENVAACVSSVLRNLGSQQFLASVVASNGFDVRTVDYRPVPMPFEEYKNGSDGRHARGFNVPMAEGEADSARIAQVRQMYNSKIVMGRGGLLSVFAGEAREEENWG